MAKERVLLKISGESLSGEQNFGLKRAAIDSIAEEIVSVKDFFELAIVMGGGNFIRGSKLKKELNLKNSIIADYAGMIGTIPNAILFQAILESDYGLETRVMTAWEIRTVAEPFIQRRATRHLEKGRIVILAGGTGNPKFSTDTAMVLRAHEIGAKIVLKGTKVDGIFDKDPKQHTDAALIPKISYMDFLNRKLEIVDHTAVTLANSCSLPIKVFNIFVKGNFKRVLSGENIGSEIV